MKKLKQQYAHWHTLSKQQQHLHILDGYLMAMASIALFVIVGIVGSLDTNRIDIIPAIFILVACFVSAYFNLSLHNVLVDVIFDLEFEEDWVSNVTPMSNIVVDEMNSTNDDLHMWDEPYEKQYERRYSYDSK